MHDHSALRTLHDVDESRLLFDRHIFMDDPDATFAGDRGLPCRTPLKVSIADDAMGMFTITFFVTRDWTLASLGRMDDLAGINNTSSNVKAVRQFYPVA